MWHWLLSTGWAILVIIFLISSLFLVGVLIRRFCRCPSCGSRQKYKEEKCRVGHSHKGYEHKEVFVYCGVCSHFFRQYILKLSYNGATESWE